jgi:ferric-dicitrate binding protein FerR (iron transport regulator)
MEGKVFFDVARDESRPFEVDADGVFVRVLGTEFMVDVTDDSAAEVYVQEGKVLFARNANAEGVVLTEGMGATLAEDAQIPVIEEKADANSIAWQRGSFLFDQTPLSEVLDCLSDYYHVSFAATDLSKKLSGEFYTDDLDLIIRLIESALDVTIIRK